jgi:hypothetical protein
MNLDRPNSLAARQDPVLGVLALDLTHGEYLFVEWGVHRATINPVCQLLAIELTTNNLSVPLYFNAECHPRTEVGQRHDKST